MARTLKRQTDGLLGIRGESAENLALRQAFFDRQIAKREDCNTRYLASLREQRGDSSALRRAFG